MCHTKHGVTEFSSIVCGAAADSVSLSSFSDRTLRKVVAPADGTVEFFCVGYGYRSIKEPHIYLAPSSVGRTSDMMKLFNL